MSIVVFASWLKDYPGITAIASILSVFSLMLFAYGYGLSVSAIDEYAIHKGYKNHVFYLQYFKYFWLVYFIFATS